MTKLEGLPDYPAVKYPRRFAVPLTDNSYMKLQKMRAYGKNPSEFVRNLIEKELAEIFPQVG